MTVINTDTKNMFIFILLKIMDCLPLLCRTVIIVNKVDNVKGGEDFFFETAGNLTIDCEWTTICFMKDRPLTAAYFFLGAFALISQTMLLREFFVVVYGNEFIFGVLLANWLIGIFTGAITGSSVADRGKNNLKIFVISLLVLSVLFPLSVIAVRLLYTISGTVVGIYITFTNVCIYSALFIIPVSFFIGFAFPIAARIRTASGTPVHGHVHNISIIYIFEALGSLLGGIVYTFFLVGRFNSFFITGLIILPLLVSCLRIQKRTSFGVVRFVSIILLVLNVIVLMPFITGKIERLTVEKRWRGFSRFPLSYSVDSKYQNISVARLYTQNNLYLNTMLSAVFPNDDDNMVLAAHLVSQHPSPKRILVIGDAVSGLGRYLLKYDIEKLVSVDIDPKVVETILAFLRPVERRELERYRAAGRFEIKTMDGRKYVKELVYEGGTFDLVYVNVSEPSTLMLNRFYTREFFTDLRRIVGERGVVALEVTASENYMGGVVSDYTASVYNTVRSVFPHIAASPGMRNFIFASGDKGSISNDPVVLEARYRGTGMEPGDLGMIFESLYPREKTEFTREALSSNRRYRLNTDEAPVAVFYFNKIMGWYGKSGFSGVLGFFEGVRLWDVVLVILIFFVIRLVFLFVTRKRFEPGRGLAFHVLVVVFSSGMAGLVLELVILHTFQNRFGDVYYIIGFIIAVFMFGLPLGAHVSNGLIGRKRLVGEVGVVKFLILVQVVIGVAALFFPWMLRGFFRVVFLNQVFIFLATVLVGFLVGLVFPLAVHLYLGRSGRTGRAAGVVDAFDHMGAAVGAFFIGVLFLPVMGVGEVCRLVSLFPVLGGILLITDVLRLGKGKG